MGEPRVVLLRQDGGRWHPPSTAGYLSEAALQQLLADEPTLLPGVLAGSRAVTEFSTRVGPSDVVVVGPGGDITVVECKLASNDEARRKIVGQVFDYAARLWKMPLAIFQERWKQRSGESFGAWLAPDSLGQLESNLSDGRFRLVLAVDSISDDLQRLVEFLNAHTLTSVQVLAVELSIAREGTFEVLIPTVYGQELAEAADRAGSAQTKPAWTVEDVTSWFADNAAELSPAIETFLRRLERINGCWLVGTSAQTPSLAVAVDTPNGRMWPYALFTGPPKPSLNLNFAYLSKAGEAGQEEFLREVRTVIPSLPADEIRAAGYRRRPGIDPALLRREGVIETLSRSVERLIADSGLLDSISDRIDLAGEIVVADSTLLDKDRNS